MCPNNNPITCPYNILHYKWYYIIKKRVPSESQDREYTIAYIRASGASEKFLGFSDAETAISLTNVVGTSNILSAHQESYVVPIYQSIKHRLHPSGEIPPTGWFPPNILPTGGAVAPPAPPLGTPLVIINTNCYLCRRWICLRPFIHVMLVCSTYGLKLLRVVAWI